MVNNVLANGRAVGQIVAALPPRVPVRGPVKSSDVTADWLTRVIGGATRGAVALSATELDGHTGTTDRRRLAVEWNTAGKEAGLPSNLFIKSSSLTAKNRIMVAALDMAINEVKFYQRASSELDGVVPRSWYSHAGIGGRFCIVFDDVVAQGAKTYALADRCEMDHARALIDTFAQLHSRFWQSPRFSSDLAFARTWSSRPGNLVLNLFYKRGRHGALRVWPEVTPAMRAVASALDAHVGSYYREFEKGPLTLLHGDSHLGNTFSLPDGRAGLLDWQVIFQGPGLREVSYWMSSGLDVDLRRNHERELIDRYLEGLRAGGVADVPSSEKAFERYRLFSAEAWDAAAMAVPWRGLQAMENAGAAFQRASLAVEDLETASLMNRLYR